MNNLNKFHRKQTFLNVSAIFLLVLLQIQLMPSLSESKPEAVATDKSAIEANYSKVPLAFEPNQGQANDSVSYLVHHGKATTYFEGSDVKTVVGDEQVSMSLIGANDSVFTGINQLESKTNYFIGNDKSKWQSNVPNYQNLFAKNVYPGIDLKYYGTNSQLEHDFIVNPGSDYKQIAFEFTGQKDLSLDKDGNLVLKSGDSELTLNAPTTYQATSNSKHTIPSQFKLDDNKTVTIALNGDYDHTQPLVIDPVLVYSTYLGGTGTEAGYGVSIDANGNAYITGYTASTNFPTSTPFQGTNSGGTYDVFITKLNPAGSALVYSTYLGGSGTDTGNGITTDSVGNAYITGVTTSTNFPTSTPFQGANNGGQDAFITKLNPAGSALIYSTYLGGSGNDSSAGIAIDIYGNMYLAGYTSSTNFPTVSPFQGSNGGNTDAFISKFNPAGSALIYSTYLGGSDGESIGDTAVDSSGSVYVVGSTNSTNFPTSSPLQGTAGGNGDAFIAKLNTIGSALIYSTYLGGSDNEDGCGIAIDVSGNAYVTGNTYSTNFPTVLPFQGIFGGMQDAFVAKLNSTGSALVYSTYLGGTLTEQTALQKSITVNSSGNAYVTGFTNSANFPTASAFQATKIGGSGQDVFVTKFSPSGSALSYSTYLGGTGANDKGKAIALGLNGNVYVVGITDSSDFPTTSPFQGTRAGSGDAFITQLSENSVNVTGQIAPTMFFAIGSTTCNMGMFSATQTQFCTHTITASSNATAGYVLSYIPTTTLTSGANIINAMASPAASLPGSEQFGMNLRANTSAGSYTATNFGADATGGSGNRTIFANYNTANVFKFATGGENLAQTTGPDLPSTYTASFITNITAISEAGTYSTPVTYNIVASY